jgi:hypothetical protein
MSEAQTVILDADIGLVKLGDTILPGEYQKMSVRRALRMPESTSSGRSGATKQPKGWEDAEISLELVLCSDDESTVRDKMDIISGLMLAADDQGRPRLYTITHWLLAAWKVRQVAFVDVESGDDNQSDTAGVTLKFVESAPPTRKVEARRRRPGATVAANSAASSGQTQQEWLGQGISLAAESEPEQSFFYDSSFSGGQTLNNTNSQLRPSLDEDVPL